MFEAGLALLDESDWVLLNYRNQSKPESINIFNFVGKMFNSISRDCKLTKNLI